MRDEDDQQGISAPAPAGDIASSRDDRARERAEARDRRANERAASALDRTKRHVAERELAAQDRLAMRETRQRETDERMSALRPIVQDDGAAPKEPKRRPSGSLRRTGDVRVERDTRNFKTVVDTRRIRELFRRGAKVEGLAAVFGLAIEEVEAVLAQVNDDRV